ncbi:hypothetical protein ACHAWF_004403 [Thalassiosira exigua]
MVIKQMKTSSRGGGRVPPSSPDVRSPDYHASSQNGNDQNARDPAPPTSGSHLFAAIAGIGLVVGWGLPFVVNAYKQERDAFSPHEASPLFHWTPFGGMFAGQEYGQRTAVAMAIGQAILYGLVLWLTAKFRPAVQSPTMKKWLFAHNVFMTIFSGMIVVANAIEMYRSSAPNDHWYCAAVETRAFDLIQVVWVLSKVFEWVDTVFLLLQHKRPIALHLWHHCSTAVLFALMTSYSPFSKTALLFNGSIHFVMYWHYARPFPRAWRRWITRFQILQFAIGIFWVLVSATTCLGAPVDERMFSILLGVGIIGSYLLLFIQFYVNDAKRRKARSQGGKSA